jgi:hypothetical protein
MIEWYSKEMTFEGQPDGVGVVVVGRATTKFPEEEKSAILTLKLVICVTRDDQTISVEWRTKDVKIWPKHEANNLDEYVLLEKYQPWITKLDKSIVGIPFKNFILKCATKAEPGVSTWLLSLQQPWL